MASSHIPTRVNFNVKKSQDSEPKKNGTTYSRGKHAATNRNNRYPIKTEKEFLVEENKRLQSELSEYKKTVEAVEVNLSKTQESLTEVQTMSEEKENRLTGEIENLKKKNEDSEEKLSSYEKKLLLSNIDPATLEHIEPTEEQKSHLREKQEKTRVTVKHLKERINSLNTESAKLLENMKIMGDQIDKVAEDCPEEF